MYTGEIPESMSDGVTEYRSRARSVTEGGPEPALGLSPFN